MGLRLVRRFEKSAEILRGVAVHCQTVSTFQSSRRSAARFRLSRATLARIFSRQNSTRVFGHTKYLQLCLCQKHPLTNTTVRWRGRTMSGRPGRSLRCNRKRKPAAWSARLTTSSGLVFLPFTAAILRLRAAETTELCRGNFQLEL